MHIKHGARSTVSVLASHAVRFWTPRTEWEWKNHSFSNPVYTDAGHLRHRSCPRTRLNHRGESSSGSLGSCFPTPRAGWQTHVVENLRHHGHLYGLAGKSLRYRISELLERFGVADRARERVERLSGGLQRRVEIAKAMLHSPVFYSLTNRQVDWM